MNQVLKPEQTVMVGRLDTAGRATGSACYVEQLLGGGGQGEVYRAMLNGKPVAIKWYFPHTATTTQQEALTYLIQKGAPDQRFLWPMELAHADDISGFGYMMPLRPPHYKSTFDLMMRRTEPSMRALATAGLQAADCYFQLHSQGLCYRDISFGNLFFDPDTGDVLICDNDNVAVNGSAAGGVSGTPRFMAPEIVRAEARPSIDTDLFSLSVLLFYMFMAHHPLEGAREAAIRCMDLPAMRELYGRNPIFIYDPADATNRPVPGYQDNAIETWKIYPQFFQDLFTRAFTAGIRDPEHGRVREPEWRRALSRLRDSIVYCGNGHENFYDADKLKASGGQAGGCWDCGLQLRLPARIRIGQGPNAQIVMLNHDAKLYSHHVDPHRLWDFSAPIAQVSQHPNNPGRWGLTNLGTEKWVTTTAAGVVGEVPPGKTHPLVVGTRINFGSSEGEIRI